MGGEISPETTSIVPWGSAEVRFIHGAAVEDWALVEPIPRLIQGWQPAICLRRSQLPLRLEGHLAAFPGSLRVIWVEGVPRDCLVVLSAVPHPVDDTGVFFHGLCAGAAKIAQVLVAGWRRVCHAPHLFSLFSRLDVGMVYLLFQAFLVPFDLLVRHQWRIHEAPWPVFPRHRHGCP